MLRIACRVLVVWVMFLVSGCGGADVTEAPGIDAAQPTPQQEFGFRRDPMDWVNSTATLQGAIVRTFVFENPRGADRELIDTRIAETLAKQQDDGHFEAVEHGEAKDKTEDCLKELLDLGVSARHAALQRAADWMLAQDLKKEDGQPYYTRSGLLVALGRGNHPRAEESMRLVLDAVPQRIIGKQCPWAEEIAFTGLWFGRQHEGVPEMMERILEWMDRELTAAGTVSYKDARALITCLGRADSALAKKLMRRMTGVILRSQERDGGFGHYTVGFLRALARHDMLDELRALPPLPSDWHVVRTIPAPADGLTSMTYGDGKLWLLRRKTQQLYRVSPEDGTVLSELIIPVPEAGGVGWYRKSIAVTAGDPYRLHLLHPGTGRLMKTVDLQKGKWLGDPVTVDDEVWICDAWHPCLWGMVPDEGGEKMHMHWFVGSLGSRACYDGDAIWFPDTWTPSILVCGRDGKLLDWGSPPFGSGCGALAYDGENMWMLDAKAKTISAIVKSPDAVQDYGWLAGLVTVDVDPIFCNGKMTTGSRVNVSLRNSSLYPVRVRVRLPDGGSDTVDIDAHRDGVMAIIVGGGYPGGSSKIPCTFTFALPLGRDATCDKTIEVPIQRKHGAVGSAAAIAVDGDLSDWGELSHRVSSPEQIQFDADAHDGPDDCGFRFDVRHDAENLYIAVEVTDDEPILDEKKAVWQQDGVEIRVSADPEPGRSRLRGHGNQWGSVLPILASPNGVRYESHRLPEGTRVACVKTDSGHNTEIAIPASYLDRRQGGSWKELRLNIAVDDYDTGVASQLWWKPDWRTNRSYSGSGTFVRKP